MFDLLWKFYEKNGNYRSAAKFLVRLAERHRLVTEKTLHGCAVPKSKSLSVYSLGQ